MIRVLLVDDHACFRQPLARVLDDETDINVYGQAGTIAEARHLLAGADIALVDLDLPDGCGLDLLKPLRGFGAQYKAMVLTGSASVAAEARAVEAGASAVFLKTIDTGQLILAIRRLAAGEEVMPLHRQVEMLRFASRMRDSRRDADRAIARLTPRELDVLRLLAEGLKDKDIAQRLVVSTETVRTHMVNILSKLEVESRLQALVFAVQHGIVQIPQMYA